MNLENWFDKGLKIEEYIKGMEVNRDEMLSISERFELSEEEKVRLQNFRSQGYKVIAITEDWCGDAMLNNAILLNLAVEARMEVRFILRDENLELMDQYLTNGTSRAIPIYIFLDKDGVEKAVWGPRADKIQALVTQLRSELPEPEAADFKEKQKEMYSKITTAFRVDESLWHEVATSIIARIEG